MAPRRPRLLFLNNQGLAGVGGGPGILRNLVRGLAADHAVTVASQDAPAEGFGVTQVRLPCPAPPGRLWRIAPMLRAWQTADAMPPGLLGQADIVVVLDVHAALALRRRTARMVYLSLSCVPLQERAMGMAWPGVLQYAWLERQLAACADAVVVASRAHAAALRRWTGLRRLSPTVLHPVFPGAPAPRTGPAIMTILAAGRMVPGKDFGVILDLAHRLRDLPCRWVLAGDGPALQALRARSAARALDDRVRFAGAVADLAPLLAQCDLLVHPSRYESFGMVLVEAMLAGRPVLCGPNVGAMELMPPGTAVDVQDLDAVERRLRALIADPAARGTAAAQAQKAAQLALAPAYIDGFRAVLRQLPGRP